MGWCELDISVTGQSPIAGSCDHGNEPVASVKYFEIPEKRSDWQLLNRDSAPCG
jgi:hypothetical protein